jgi:DNA polymerase elongation subunit (family B)
MYVKPEVRKGLLGRMLTELLETRVMVKQAMKSVKEDKASTAMFQLWTSGVYTLLIAGPQKSP